MISPLGWRKWTGLSAPLFFAVCAGSILAAQPSAKIDFEKVIKPILTEYCSDCHMDGAKKGGMTLDEFKSSESMLDDHELWWNVLKYLRAGLMPPMDKPRPDQVAKEKVDTWIKASVFKSDPRNPDPGRVTVRRLNRIEYRNSIRDLLGVDFNSDIEFPPDDTGYGFDNIGDVLTVSPMLIEKYVAAAKTIVSQGVPTISRVMPEFIVQGHDFRAEGGRPREGRRRQNRDASIFLPYDRKASVSSTFDVDISATYKLALDFGVRGGFDFDPRKCKIVFKLDDEEVLQKELGWYDNKNFPFELERKLKPGEHKLTFELEPLTEEGTNSLSIRLGGVTVKGPLEKNHWVLPANYRRFFPKDPPQQAAERRTYAKEILRKMASRAYRRPLDDKSAERLTAFAEGIYQQPGKSFEEGVARSMEAIIASPRFLFRLEENQGRAGDWSPVDEYSLASRLSYFLWSTLPDEELLKLAESGTLRKNLPAQVKRMLADRRSEAFIQNFTGQWLQLRDLSGISIDARAVHVRDIGEEKEFREQREAFRARQAARSSDKKKDPKEIRERDERARNFFRFKPKFELDRDLRQAMKNETEMFFSNIIREDLSVTELLDANYTFLNEKLAEFYGLTNLNVTGGEMRKVELPPDSPRGGVLAHGSILVVTSNPDRTSPVKRGMFVLNNILGTPAPPPPPNVPALEATEKDFKDQEPTLRVALEAHRAKPQCASCHARMDSIGLGMENFNAMGMWREKERGQVIDPAGKLITGESFNDVRELKRVLAKDHLADFYTCITEKLLTYALGRGLEDDDVEPVDQIVQRLQKENGRFSALLLGVIESAPFQQRRNQANPVFSDQSETLQTSKLAKTQ